ncbi:centrosomal protein of 128 kDa isoform X6 [Rhineura floridana]|uniref:centrosomal protein of 128 kDa isoform X6 n=1 Tax=Rhineura floridana TaxID=261503 RepID=UPI002AC836AA|nr:centrosomal protein of 128 kDa isoform X6 [Rhineura floridana]
MADSSSDSDNFRRRIGRRGPVRATRVRNHGGEDVTEKIHTLANTLQDTNRNLRHVDQMLGQYREYNNEQAEAIANLKETLEHSIGQLRSQRLLRNSGVRSASLSSLYASDLDGGASEGCHFQPTSPLRDYGTGRRRSRSAVRFVDQRDNLDQLHSLHQSLRDLGSEQVRLQDDLSRELSRRNRTEVETKRMLVDLSDKLNESQRQETVSERVERRLQEIEREIRSERQLVERRQDQLGHMSLHLQEALKQQDAKANEVEISLKNKVLKIEGEKNKLEQDLELSQRKLDQSENSREALFHQIEDLRSQLLRAEEERLNLQHQISQVAIHHQSRADEQEDDKRKRRVPERSDLEKQEMEKQIWGLRAQLNHSAVMSEIEELKRCIERKDKERAQLGIQIEVLTSDLEKRETQQQRMLSQLKEIQSNYKICENECRAAELQVNELAQQLEESTKEAERYLAEFRQSEVLRLENEKKKEELKLKAQESIRHWKLKCKKLELETEKQTELHNQLMEKNNLAELLEERNLVKAHRRQVEKMKVECDKLMEELIQKEEENAKFRRKYQLMKQELDETHKRINSEDDHLRRREEDRLQLHDQLRSLQNEQESILCMIGSEIDAACEVLSRDSVEKFTAISLTPGIQNDPHRWLAETKTKLQWLCEEVKERETKEKKLRRQLLQSREQLKHLTLSKENEHQHLIGQLEKQEQLLDEVYQEKKDLLEKTLRKEEDIGALQERITALETSTRVALDHLESVPEKLNLLEDFRNFEDSHNQTENIEERDSKYKEIMGSLQQHLEDSKRRLEDFRDKKNVADISSIQNASSSWRANTSFMSSSLLSNSGSFTKSTFPLDSNATKKGAISVTVNGMKLQTEREKY